MQWCTESEFGRDLSAAEHHVECNSLALRIEFRMLICLHDKESKFEGNNSHEAQKDIFRALCVRCQVMQAATQSLKSA
jgi:hypothetical protein